MDEEEIGGFSTSLYEGAAGYDTQEEPVLVGAAGYGDVGSTSGPAYTSAGAPLTSPSTLGGQAQAGAPPPRPGAWNAPTAPGATPAPPMVGEPTFAETSALLDIVSSVLRFAGGAALGYYASDEGNRAKMAAIGALACGIGGLLGTLAFSVYLAKEKGR